MRIFATTGEFGLSRISRESIDQIKSDLISDGRGVWINTDDGVVSQYTEFWQAPDRLEFEFDTGVSGSVNLPVQNNIVLHLEKDGSCKITQGDFSSALKKQVERSAVNSLKKLRRIAHDISLGTTEGDGLEEFVFPGSALVYLDIEDETNFSFSALRLLMVSADVSGTAIEHCVGVIFDETVHLWEVEQNGGEYSVANVFDATGRRFLEFSMSPSGQEVSYLDVSDAT